MSTLARVCVAYATRKNVLGADDSSKRRATLSWNRCEAVIGDIGKLIVILLSLAFIVCIILEDNIITNWFSDSYMQEGFCIANMHLEPMYQSHAICLCFNMMLSVVMVALVSLGHHHLSMSDEALRPIQKNALSLLTHGIGHGFLAFRTVSTSSDDGTTQRYVASNAFETLSPMERLVTFVVLFFVWFGFMRDSRRKLSTAIMFALIHNVLQVFVIPTRFFFTHVLMAVPLHSGVKALFFRDINEKHMYYAMEAWLVDVPILLMSFGEATACEAFFIHYGGHVWFDMVVPVGFIVYYLILVIGGKEWQHASLRTKYA